MENDSNFTERTLKQINLENSLQKPALTAPFNNTSTLLSTVHKFALLSTDHPMYCSLDIQHHHSRVNGTLLYLHVYIISFLPISLNLLVLYQPVLYHFASFSLRII